MTITEERELQAQVEREILERARRIVASRLISDMRTGTFMYRDSPSAPKCECGSEAVGSPAHSDYCPKEKKHASGSLEDV